MTTRADGAATQIDDKIEFGRLLETGSRAANAKALMQAALEYTSGSRQTYNVR